MQTYSRGKICAHVNELQRERLSDGCKHQNYAGKTTAQFTSPVRVTNSMMKGFIIRWSDNKTVTWEEIKYLCQLDKQEPSVAESMLFIVFNSQQLCKLNRRWCAEVRLFCNICQNVQSAQDLSTARNCRIVCTMSWMDPGSLSRGCKGSSSEIILNPTSKIWAVLQQAARNCLCISMRHMWSIWNKQRIRNKKSSATNS